MSAHCYSHKITVSLSKLASGNFEIIMTPLTSGREEKHQYKKIFHSGRGLYILMEKLYFSLSILCLILSFHKN